jgi:hypothetical protein
LKALSTLFLLLFASSSTLLSQESPPREPQPESQPLSYEDWLETSRFADNGRMKDDSLTKLPEISTLFGVGRGGKFKVAIGIELFHDRRKPRKHRWKLELQIADDELALGLGYILVPVANFTMGPYVGYDFEENHKTYGLRFGIFKF